MNASASYKKNAIKIASAEEIMLMLMEGAVMRLKSARQCWADQEHARARELRSESFAIITELDNTLDRTKGDPELIQELDALYSFMIRQLNEVAFRDDFDKLQAVEETMVSLYSGFKDAVATIKQGDLNNNSTAAYDNMNQTSTKQATL